jgi:hypothetical protein
MLLHNPLGSRRDLPSGAHACGSSDRYGRPSVRLRAGLEAVPFQNPVMKQFWLPVCTLRMDSFDESILSA